MDLFAHFPGHVLDAFLRGAEVVATHPLLALIPLFTAGTIGLTLYRAYRIRRVRR